MFSIFVFKILLRADEQDGTIMNLLKKIVEDLDDRRLAIWYQIGTTHINLLNKLVVNLVEGGRAVLHQYECSQFSF